MGGYRMVVRDVLMDLDDIMRRAEQGDPEAQYRLGILYGRGEGVEVDVAKSVAWRLKAAEKGHYRAQCSMAGLYEGGELVPRNMAEAKRWAAIADETLQKCVAQGDPDALCIMGEKAECRDCFSEALQWYQKAADQGSMDGLRRMGKLYCNEDAAEWDLSEAVAIFNRAIDLGDTESLCCLGDIYRDDAYEFQDDRRAYLCYLEAAHRGEPRAYYPLGVMCELGRGVAENPAEAIQWYSKVVMGFKYPSARYRLAVMYLCGRGVEQNEPEGARHCFEAAERLHPYGSILMGWLYENGRGVPQDYARAFKCYKSVENWWVADGLYALGRLLEWGRGVPANIAEARKYYRRAAEQNHGGAIRALERLCMEWPD